MANLQAALDEYKLEIAGLDKQKTDLTREIVQLKSKKVFLTSSIDKLDKTNTDILVAYHTKFKQLKADELKLEDKINIAQEDLDAISQAKQVAESELETLESQYEQEIIGHNKRLASAKEAVKAVEALKNDATKQLDDINKQIPIRLARVDKLNQIVKQTELDTDLELSELEQLIVVAKQRLSKTDDKVEGVLKTLEDITSQVEAKKTELIQLDKKHQDFLIYEKHAMAALKARESALLAGEAELKVARRRNPASVLDNLG